MIPNAYLQEWSAHAPWPDPRQIGQDPIICRALVGRKQRRYLVDLQPVWNRLADGARSARSRLSLLASTMLGSESLAGLIVRCASVAARIITLAKAPATSMGMNLRWTRYRWPEVVSKCGPRSADGRMPNAQPHGASRPPVRTFSEVFVLLCRHQARSLQGCCTPQLPRGFVTLPSLQRKLLHRQGPERQVSPPGPEHGQRSQGEVWQHAHHGQALPEPRSHTPSIRSNAMGSMSIYRPANRVISNNQPERREAGSQGCCYRENARSVRVRFFHREQTAIPWLAHLLMVGARRSAI